MTFLGFYDKDANPMDEKVRLELMLVKLSMKKRKESSSPVVQNNFGSCEVPVNPSEDNPPNKAPALSIPSKNFSLSGLGGVGRARTYSLLIRLYPEAEGWVSEENSEPSYKKFKRDGDLMGRVVSAELVVYDKHSRCLLTEGEYELILSDSQGCKSKLSPKKTPTWEIIDIDPSSTSPSDHQFQVFSHSPTLKFRLSWCSEPAGSMVERPRPLMPRDNGQDAAYLRRAEKAAKQAQQQKERKNMSSSTSSESGKSGEKPTRIVYQFLYNNNSRQQTEAREDLHCPWCSLNCLEVNALLMHLKHTHPRFLFTWVEIAEGVRVDVSVSELYDSTYCGNPHDLISQPPGFAFSRNNPVQRTPITNILVCRPSRTVSSILESELRSEESGGGYESSQRPFVSGHNRLYHYSTTCLPIPPHAILNSVQEEDETDPEWLKVKTSKMIDDFTDVNEGEKDFMKMWNHHVQHFTFVGDCQMPQALTMFLDSRGKDIIQKNLFRNFCLHLVNLFEFGVIGPAHVFTAVSKLQELVLSFGLQHTLSWGGLSVLRDVLVDASKKHQRKNFAGIFSKSSINNGSSSSSSS